MLVSQIMEEGDQLNIGSRNGRCILWAAVSADKFAAASVAGLRSRISALRAVGATIGREGQGAAEFTVTT